MEDLIFQRGKVLEGFESCYQKAKSRLGTKSEENISSTYDYHLIGTFINVL